jgi:hypothetical protein
LDSDLKDIGKRLGFSFPQLPQDDVKSHKNPEHFNKKLSEKAIANLKVWYSRDYDFLNFLNEISENGIIKK